MKNILWWGRLFYGTGIAGIGFQQFIYSAFRPVLLPYWPASVHGVAVWAYLTGALLILTGAAIIFNIKARIISVGLAIFFFLLFVCCHVYYQLVLSTGDFYLGLWTDPLKELALSGGALLVAASLPEENSFKGNKLFRLLGRIFFSVMLIIFGIDHFLYTAFVAALVPRWLPGHIFWTYFGAAGLIGSGICILIKFQIKPVSILCGIMIFLWFVILHIPRAIADPYTEKGNEITSVFEALAFSGVAFVTAWIYRHKIWNIYYGL